MAFVCVEFHVTAFKLTYSCIQFFSSGFKAFSKFPSQIYVVLSSEKLHILNSLRKKNKSFR